MPGAAESLALYFAVMLGTMALALPIEPATLLVAKVAAPWLIASVASAASVVLAVFDYGLIRRALRTRLLETLRKRPLFAKAERWARAAPFLTTALFAGLPLPFIVVRVLVPVSGYPLRSYALAVAVGRFARFFVVAAFGTAWSRYLPTELLVGVMIGSAVLAIGSAIAHRRGWLGFGRERAATAAKGDNAAGTLATDPPKP